MNPLACVPARVEEADGAVRQAYLFDRPGTVRRLHRPLSFRWLGDDRGDRIVLDAETHGQSDVAGYAGLRQGKRMDSP